MLIWWIVDNLLAVLNLVLLLYCVFSWFIRDPYNKIYRFLSSICDPILQPFRALLSKIPFLQSCPIDFSPLVLMMFVRFLQRLF